MSVNIQGKRMKTGMNMECICCEELVKPIDIAATKKFINRGAEEFYCMDCLEKELNVSRKLLYQKMSYFKSMGCTLFQDIEL